MSVGHGEPNDTTSPWIPLILIVAGIALTKGYGFIHRTAASKTSSCISPESKKPILPGCQEIVQGRQRRGKESAGNLRL
jgi:hypothetical protein